MIFLRRVAIVTLLAITQAAFNIAVAVAALFVGAMLFLISGLSLFLREVRIATARMRQGMETVLASGSTTAGRPAPKSNPDA